MEYLEGRALDEELTARATTTNGLGGPASGSSAPSGEAEGAVAVAGSSGAGAGRGALAEGSVGTTVGGGEAQPSAVPASEAHATSVGRASLTRGRVPRMRSRRGRPPCHPPAGRQGRGFAAL
jgi:hypothetical protein